MRKIIYHPFLFLNLKWLLWIWHIFTILYSYFHRILYVNVVHEFYYTKTKISCLKNTGPMCLKASVAHLPLPDNNFRAWVAQSIKCWPANQKTEGSILDLSSWVAPLRKVFYLQFLQFTLAATNVQLRLHAPQGVHNVLACTGAIAGEGTVRTP